MLKYYDEKNKDEDCLFHEKILRVNREVISVRFMKKTGINN